MASLVQAVRLALHYGEEYLGVTDVFKHTYAPSPVDVVYPEDYTGLPQ